MPTTKHVGHHCFMKHAPGTLHRVPEGARLFLPLRLFGRCFGRGFGSGLGFFGFSAQHELCRFGARHPGFLGVEHLADFAARLGVGAQGLRGHFAPALLALYQLLWRRLFPVRVVYRRTRGGAWASVSRTWSGSSGVASATRRRGSAALVRALGHGLLHHGGKVIDLRG